MAAEKCKDRAVEYYKAERYLLAIKQLHHAKIKWFSAENIRGSLMSMLILSDCYRKLGLIYPAKYYAACVAFLAHHGDDDGIKSLIPRALFMYADCCFQGGEWLTFAHISRWALAAHNIYEEYPLDIEKHKDLQRLFVHAAIVRTVAKRFGENLSAAFDEVLSKWPVDPGTRAGIEALSTSDTSYWQTASIEDFWKTAETELWGRPFSDVGGRRSVCWKALGVSWVAEFENNHLTTCMSEEFVSTLQIILADLAIKDLVLLPTSVHISIHVTNGQQVDVQEVPDNKVATWRVGFPQAWVKNLDALHDVRTAVLSLAVTVLGKCSMLSYESFFGEIERVI